MSAKSVGEFSVISIKSTSTNLYKTNTNNNKINRTVQPFSIESLQKNTKVLQPQKQIKGK